MIKMKVVKKLVKKRVVSVLTDIINRGQLTVADCFVVEVLLTQADLITRVEGSTIHFYNEAETELNVIDFLKEYRSQIKKRKVVN